MHFVEPGRRNRNKRLQWSCCLQPCWCSRHRQDLELKLQSFKTLISLLPLFLEARCNVSHLQFPFDFLTCSSYGDSERKTLFEIFKLQYVSLFDLYCYLREFDAASNRCNLSKARSSFKRPRVLQLSKPVPLSLPLCVASVLSSFPVHGSFSAKALLISADPRLCPQVSN